jgi:hypothetical protein
MHNLPLVGLALLAPLVCSAEPLVTITCDPPKGVSQRYGITDEDRMKTAHGVPAPHLIPPEPDGYKGKPIFIVDSNKRKLTTLWADAQPNEEAREVPIIKYSPLQITALDAHPGPNGAVILYTFYPKLGILLWAMQYTPPLTDAADQSIFFAKCEYSWSGKP